LLLGTAILFWNSLTSAAETNPPSVEIQEIKPTVFFPKVEPGEPLKQLAQLKLKNSGGPVAARVRVAMRGQPELLQPLGELPAGESTRGIQVPDITHPAELTLKLLLGDEDRLVDQRTLTWQPQRKWKIYHVAYSHHDLGYADYYHMMRRDVREWGTELALLYCRQTDDWEEDSKYRWTIETAELMADFIQAQPKAILDELVQRIREGRIELGGIHNSVNTDGMSYEALARLFYTPNRYIVDLLGIEPRKTAILDDVVGLTRPLPLYSKEADVPYFYHGRNALQDQLQPASAQPVYYWMAPDGDRNHMTLFRTQHYHLSGAGQFGAGLEALNLREVEKLITEYANRPDWPYDSILSVDSWDFSIPEMRKVTQIRDWNNGFSYPRIVCATMTMFYDAIAAQMDPAKVFVFDKDAPNTWIDQDYTDVEAAGQARLLGYELPTIEKLSTLAMALGGKGYPWTDIWQAYHRLLMYHEHTNAAYAEGPIYAPYSLKDKTAANALYYEAEVEMHRRLAAEGQEFAAEAQRAALAKLEAMIPTTADQTLVVFNPLTWPRTGVVRVEGAGLPESFDLVDNATRRKVVWQKLPDGAVVFLGENIPSLGYKTYGVFEGKGKARARSATLTATATTLENKFYRVTFDAKTGGITSLLDKPLGVELVDQGAPYRLNEYLYHHVHGKEPKWHRVESANLTPWAGPVAAVMTATVQAFGTEKILQEVILYSDVKRIDFVQRLEKSSCGRTLADYKARDPERANNHKEAVFYALPFNIPEFQIRHELAGAVVEPITDQAVGSSTDYYNVQHFVDIFGPRYGVTLATLEGGLVEYGKPRPSQTWIGESILKKPEQSHMYLYLMNNWFGTNIRIDQPGPKKFRWSLRSHAGDWKQSQAYTFGWDVSHPLLARVMTGRQEGKLPADRYSFLEINKPNVVLTTMKPAEANGSGLILRLHELAGAETEVTVSLPFLDEISQANETSLIEVDRPTPVKILNRNQVTFTIRPHGVKTIRLQLSGSLPRISQPAARALSDMEVELTWRAEGGSAETVSHYNIYRDTVPDFAPGLRHWVGSSTQSAFTDRPRLHYGGWIDNRLEPESTYFYKVRAVDRWNNEGPASSPVLATTLKAGERSAVPARVQGLYVVNVSPVSPHNYLALWFYTNCESDVTRYQIFRGTQAGLGADFSNLLTEVDATTKFSHTTPHGFGTVTRELREYNRILYVDQDVKPGTTYYYQVRAVDRNGVAGEPSREASARTK
jgi:hypothetical protein